MPSSGYATVCWTMRKSLVMRLVIEYAEMGHIKKKTGISLISWHDFSYCDHVHTLLRKHGLILAIDLLTQGQSCEVTHKDAT